MLAESDFFIENALVKPESFFQPPKDSQQVFLSRDSIFEMMSQIAELEMIRDAPKTLRQFIEKIDSDGNSHIWLISDSANNQKTISQLIRGKDLAVRDIPQGLIDALIEQKVFTRAELE